MHEVEKIWIKRELQRKVSKMGQIYCNSNRNLSRNSFSGNGPKTHKMDKK